MPASTAEASAVMPAGLAAHLHALLVATGMGKTAKKFASEFDGELTGTAELQGTTLLELYEAHLAPPPAAKKDKKAKKAKAEVSNGGEAENDTVEEGQPAKKKDKRAKKKAESDAEDGDDGDEEKPKAKKAKKGKQAEAAESSNEGAEKAAAAPAAAAEDGAKATGKNKKGNVPFQRIKSDEVSYLKVRGGEAEAARLLDNTFESKFKDTWADGEVREDYGAKASAILSQVRGKDFRHEKTKKKRGTYKGGPVDMASNSIKFVNSSDEDE